VVDFVEMNYVDLGLFVVFNNNNNNNSNMFVDRKTDLFEIVIEIVIVIVFVDKNIIEKTKTLI